MPTNSSEFEIKLLFPKNRLEAIEKFIVSKGGIRRQHLQAAYIDTSDFLLTQAGIAFRLRKEGRQWVQTLKVSTPNPLERLEHNVTLSAAGNAIPSWSFELHQNHDSGKYLYKRFPKLRVEDLKICYQTDIWRRKAVVNTRQGSIEYALDIGSIYSNLSTGVIASSVQELEIELKQGDFRNVLHHAQNIIKVHKAYIDTRSRSERGFLLASGLKASPALRAKSISLKNAENIHEIIELLIHSCLAQVLANQSVLSAEYENYSEYLHQLRVGLRRLKVLFKYLARHDIFISDEGADTFKKAFDRLGQYRDNDYVTGVLNPILSSLGGPEIKLSSIKDLPSPSHITRDKEFQLLLLELMSVGLSPVKPIAEPGDSKRTKEELIAFRKMATKLIDGGFHFVSDRVSIFSTLRDEEIHSLRKKMKFMRYSLEFFKDYCNKNKYSNFFKAISVALECFGLFNDICVAITRIEGLTQDDPNLLFALGWLKAERQRIRSLCEKSAKKFVQTEIAWGT